MGTASLKGKCALVTGGARRLGKEIALALAEEGADIIIHYNESAAEAEKLCKELRKKEVQCFLIKADFERAKDYENLIASALEKAGKLDILVNSASIFPANTLYDLKWEELIGNIQINAWAPFYLCRDFAAKARKGAVVNLLDSRIKGFSRQHAAYLFSKKLLKSLTEAAALEFAPDVRVNGIAPGLILPPPDKDEEYLDGLIEDVPLKRRGNVRDITDAVLFLINSGFITGEVIYVDGGWHLISQPVK